MRALRLLSNRDAVNIAQLRDQLVGVLNTGQAEIINEVLYVDGTNGSDTHDGKRPDRAFVTITAALAAAVADDIVAVFPGTYAEHVTMAVADVTLLGLGSKPQDVLLLDATDLATAMIAVTGDNCVISNLRVSLGHANNVDALSITASDCLVEDCEFVKHAAIALDVAVDLIGPSTKANNTIRRCLFKTHTIGVQFTTSTTAQAGARIIDCLFEAGVTADINDGGAAVSVTLVLIQGCTFAGTPTDFIVLTAGTSTGLLTDCWFNSATLATGTITIDAGVLCVGCYTGAGLSAGQPA